MVLAAFTGADGYDDRPVLDALGWDTMLTNLDRIADHAASREHHGVTSPHTSAR